SFRRSDRRCDDKKKFPDGKPTASERATANWPRNFNANRSALNSWPANSSAINHGKGPPDCRSLLHSSCRQAFREAPLSARSWLSHKRQGWPVFKSGLSVRTNIKAFGWRSGPRKDKKFGRRMIYARDNRALALS